MTTTTTPTVPQVDPYDESPLPEGVVAYLTEDGKIRLRFTEPCPSWCAASSDCGAAVYLEDLAHWYSSREIVMSLHDVDPEDGDRESIQILLRQGAADGDPRVSFLLTNTDAVVRMTGNESIAFAYLLHEVLSMTDARPLLPTGAAE